VKKLALVLPCYNESKSLLKLTERVLNCVRQRGLSPETFSLVLVENGSKDNSWQVIQTLLTGPNKAYMESVRVPVNQGYGYGVLQGLQFAALKAETVAWSHADEQCDPDDVFRAWEVLARLPDPKKALVKGTRSGRRGTEWLISRGFDTLTSLLMGRLFTEINAQPKVFDRSLVALLSHPPKDFAFDFYVLAEAKRHGYRFSSIPVHFGPRPHGVSNWSHSFLSRVRTIAKMVRYLFKYRFGALS
jgi:glycosyltransferase involved in cell wall biosynthesis